MKRTTFGVVAVPYILSYNPNIEQWRFTGNFNQPNRGWPGHADHSIIVLDDGRVLAVAHVHRQRAPGDPVTFVSHFGPPHERTMQVSDGARHHQARPRRGI